MRSSAVTGGGTAPGAQNLQEVREIAAARFRRTQAVSDRFFSEEADAVSRACWDMARRFHRGGHLLACGSGPCVSDAYHVSVEFVHPVIVGKRALPARVLDGNAAERLGLLGRPEDIALGISSDGDDPRVLEMLRVARRRSLLTVGLAGGEGGGMTGEALDHLFIVPDEDPTVVQEVHETLYHVLWELVHVFFDHKGLL